MHSRDCKFAGAGLVVLGTSGAVLISAAAVAGTTAEVTVLGLATGSGLQLTAATVGTNLAVSTARGWTDSQSWSGIAVAGGTQVLTDGCRLTAGAGVGTGVGYFERFLNFQNSNAPVFADQLKQHNAKLARFAKLGGGSVLPVMFAAKDLMSEWGRFRSDLPK